MKREADLPFRKVLRVLDTLGSWVQSHNDIVPVFLPRKVLLAVSDSINRP